MQKTRGKSKGESGVSVDGLLKTDVQLMLAEAPSLLDVEVETGEHHLGNKEASPAASETLSPGSVLDRSQEKLL